MTSFWQALKTMFIAIGMNHQQQAQSRHKSGSTASGAKAGSRSKSINSKRSGGGKSSDVNGIISDSNSKNEIDYTQTDSPPDIKITKNTTEHQQDNMSYHSGDYMDECTIEWPQWAILLSQRNDLQPISRNQMDNDEKRKENGFKGKNYVYQDRKFFSKYYWKGFSTINRDQQSIQQQNEKLSAPTTTIPQNRLLSPNINNKQDTTPSTISPISLTESGNRIILDHLPDRMLVGVVYWSMNCEGPPGCVHGGALATLFDDSMACCIRYYYNNNYEEDSDSPTISQPPSPSSTSSTTTNNSSTTISNNNEPKQKKYAVTANLSVNYKKFVPLNSVSLIETRIERRDGKKIYVHSCIKDQSGSIRAEATAIWIVVNLSTPSSSNSSFPSSPTLPSTTPIAPVSSPSTPNLLTSPRDD